MKPPCEVMVQDILPSVRAMIARKLVDTYGFSQSQTAEKLGTTQPAISQYKRELRGSSGVFKTYPQLLEITSRIAKRIASGEVTPLQTTLEFCELCKFLKEEKIVCDIHRRLHPALESCDVCFEEPKK